MREFEGRNINFYSPAKTRRKGMLERKDRICDPWTSARTPQPGKRLANRKILRNELRQGMGSPVKTGRADGSVMQVLRIK